MKNILILIACAVLFAQCRPADVEVQPTGSFDTLGINWMTIERSNVIYYFQGTGAKAATVYTDLHEEAYEELNNYFEATLPRKLRFFVWTDWSKARQILNHFPGFALPENCICHVRANQTLGHEIAHILAYWAWGVPFNSYSKFTNEGLAVAFDLSGRDKIALAKESLEGSNIKSILEIWQDAERTPDEILYPVGGAFMEFMRNQSQPDEYKTLIKNQTIQDAEQIYGKDRLHTLIASFNSQLGL